MKQHNTTQHNTTFRTILMLCIAAMISSCVKNLDVSEDPPTQTQSSIKTKIPYANHEALNEFINDAPIVDYEFARKLAILDISFNKYYEKYGWEDCTLSPEPVIVYGFDNKPISYDYIVFDTNGNNIGTVVVNARKNIPVIIQKIIPKIEEYGDIMTKTSGDTFYADQYGARYTGMRQTTKGSVVPVVADIQTRTTYNSPQYLSDAQILAHLKDKIYPLVYINDNASLSQAITNIEARYVSHTTNTQAMWDALDSQRGNITNGGDVFNYASARSRSPHLPKMFEGEEGGGGGGGGGTTSPFSRLTLTNDGEVAWIDQAHNIFRNMDAPTGIICGPWVVGFILSSYENKPVDPYQFIKDGYTIPYHPMYGSVEGAMPAPGMNNALKDYSKGAIRLNLAGVNEWNTYWHIREKNLAVRMLINWQGIDTQWHWTCIYGSFRVKRALTTNYYFMQADNGALYNGLLSDRKLRNPSDNDNYHILQWFDTIFEVLDNY